MPVRPPTEQEKAARDAARQPEPPSDKATYPHAAGTATYRDKVGYREAEDTDADHH